MKEKKIVAQEAINNHEPGTGIQRIRRCFVERGIWPIGKQGVPCPV